MQMAKSFCAVKNRVHNQKDARRNSVQNHVLASPPCFFLNPLVKKRLFFQIVVWCPVLMKSCCNPCWKWAFRVVCLDFRVVKSGPCRVPSMRVGVPGCVPSILAI